MSVRKIIKINQELCNGCSLCVDACHEGAIVLQDGRATLLRDDYCDGLGDCLPACPTGAISFEFREALPYDEAAVQELLEQKQKITSEKVAKVQTIFTNKESLSSFSSIRDKANYAWPIKLHLVNTDATYLEKAHILIAADCSAFSCPDFHERYAQNKTLLITCPKLESLDHIEKLKSIFQTRDIQSITVVRMSVPCCEALLRNVKRALDESGKTIHLCAVRMGLDGAEMSS